MSEPKLLELPGYVFEERRHASGILKHDFQEACKELAVALEPLEITTEQVIEGGGGKTSITQSIERALKAEGWQKKTFGLSQTIDGTVIDSTTHEIDHFRGFPDRPGIALEIEWNNKDPFFDRDLGAFARLHLLGVMSVGVIVTRGPSLRAALKDVFERHYTEVSAPTLRAAIRTLSAKDQERVSRASLADQRRVLANIKVASKYGEATTHWKKLMDRIVRGLGNPCPLLLVGIEAERLH